MDEGASFAHQIKTILSTPCKPNLQTCISRENHNIVEDPSLSSRQQRQGPGVGFRPCNNTADVGR